MHSPAALYQPIPDATVDVKSVDWEQYISKSLPNASHAEAAAKVGKLLSQQETSWTLKNFTYEPGPDANGKSVNLYSAIERHVRQFKRALQEKVSDKLKEINRKLAPWQKYAALDDNIVAQSVLL